MNGRPRGIVRTKWRPHGPLKIWDDLMEVAMSVCLVAVLLYGAYALYDAYIIYVNADSSSVYKFKPKIDEETGTYSFEELLAMNPDVVAWLSIPDTNIDYPIVQGQNNSDYLNMDPFGNYSISGSIFLDSQNTPDFSDAYNIVYGHHMDGDFMFGGLDHFLDEDYLNSHRNGTLILPGATYDIKWNTCKKVDGFDINVYSTSKSDTTNVASKMPELAFAWRDGKNIIALSTCSDSETNGRVVLFGSFTGPGAGE